MQEKLESCGHTSSGRAESGEPTPTGKTYLGYVDRYRKRHPDAPFVPMNFINQWWIRAAQKNNDTELLNAINAVRVNEGLPKVK